MTVLRRLWRQFCLMLGNQPSLRLYLLPLLQAIWPGFLPGQYRAGLVSASWQTPDMLLLTLNVSSRWPGFVPGQHLLLTLTHNGRSLSRPFSICSPLSLWQAQGQIELCCKVSQNGSFTPLLASLKSNSIVNISAAQGNFSWQQPAKPALFITAYAAQKTPPCCSVCNNWPHNSHYLLFIYPTAGLNIATSSPDKYALRPIISSCICVALLLLCSS